MRANIPGLFGALILTLAGVAGCADNAQETVYTNGFVYTVNSAQPTAAALAVRDGVIIAVGSNQEVQAQASERARVVDLNGRMLMPGIHDMHAHPMEAGEKYNFQCAFPFTFTMADDRRKTDGVRRRNPAWRVDSRWPVGHGVDADRHRATQGRP